MIKLLCAVPLCLLPAAATASSPDAWATLYKQAAQACVKASGLKAARTSAPITFSDANAQVAVLVTGTFPQPALRGATGTSLCLYDKRRRLAEVQEAKGWRAAR